MNTVASTFALICVALVSAVYAADCDEPCSRTCSPVNCDSFDCGMSKTCLQTCLLRTCNEMRCGVDERCTQICSGCKSKMVCSSPHCSQICSGDFCEMECTSSVTTCEQTCNKGSKCKISCDKNETNCQLGCEGANCTGTAVSKVTKQVNECDELTGICKKSCTGDCKGKTLSCGDGKYKECTLSCENGCKMECDSTVDKCNQKCIGDALCTSVCDAMTCVEFGRFHTSSTKLNCTGVNCTGAPEKPKIVHGACDERTGICKKSCAGDCRGRTLSCDGGNFKECILSCEDGCKMKCDSTVEKCNQTCIGDALCSSVCDAKICNKVGQFHTSSAKLNCTGESGVNCTGSPEKPKVVHSSCDLRTGSCTKSCTGDCRGETLSCGGGRYKECTLSCEDGCKMECDSSVEKCKQTCIGINATCTSVCDAKNCIKVGKFHTSSAMICQLNYLMFGLFVCMMLFHVRNV